MAPPMMGGGPGRGRQAANAGKPKNTKKTLPVKGNVSFILLFQMYIILQQ